MLQDTPELRGILADLFPGFVIEESPAPSGQRVVYFGHFSSKGNPPEQEEWHNWGGIVLKVSAGLSARSVAYLQREAATLGVLDSPGFPKLFMENLFVENPVTEEALNPNLYVTFEERIESEPLSNVMDKFNSEVEICDFLLCCTSVLKDLWGHNNKYIHRDLKPANILIKPDGSVAIIDLGIVRESGETGLTNTEAPYGPCTPGYASPEQVKNDKLNITFRSDLFSLGVIGYELYTGGNPFFQKGMLAHDVFQRVLYHEPPLLKDSHGASDRFSNLIQRLLGKEPYLRFRRVEIFENELHGIIEEWGG